MPRLLILKDLVALMAWQKKKAQIYSGLGDQGVAIINADDHYADYWKKSVGAKKIITFGIEKKADVTAENIQFNAATQPSFLLKTPDGSIPVNLKILGLHNVMNALAAAAAAVAKKIPLKLIKQGLEQNTAVNKRLCEVNGFAGAKIIDDSYNANPLSVRAAMEMCFQKRKVQKFWYLVIWGSWGVKLLLSIKKLVKKRRLKVFRIIRFWRFIA